MGLSFDELFRLILKSKWSIIIYIEWREPHSWQSLDPTNASAFIWYIQVGQILQNRSAEIPKNFAEKMLASVGFELGSLQ